MQLYGHCFNGVGAPQTPSLPPTIEKKRKKRKEAKNKKKKRVDDL